MSLSDKRNKQILSQCIYLTQALEKIEKDGGHGSIEFEVKANAVSFRRYAVRDHPKT
jgi:hypothetical protein